MTELYILPFDHRGSFMKIIGANSPPTDEDVKKARDYKKVIYGAFEKSISDGVPFENAGILVDEWLGSDILRDAKSKGYVFCTPLEKSGQEYFEFERTDWKKQISEIDPTYVKVLVRYNPEGDRTLNAKQVSLLFELSKHLQTVENKFLFELLVPATDEQMERVGGDKNKYDQEIRPGLMVDAIKAMQNASVNPIIWKLEGLDTTEKMQMVGDQVRAGNSEAGIIILGRGESAEKAEHWLKMGAEVDNAVGFAVGRTIFKDALSDLSKGKISREEALNQISKNYSFFVDVWEKVKKG